MVFQISAAPLKSTPFTRAPRIPARLLYMQIPRLQADSISKWDMERRDPSFGMKCISSYSKFASCTNGTDPHVCHAYSFAGGPIIWGKSGGLLGRPIQARGLPLGITCRCRGVDMAMGQTPNRLAPSEHQPIQPLK